MTDTRPLDGLGPILGQSGSVRNLGRSENDLEDSGQGQSYQQAERRHQDGDEGNEPQRHKVDYHATDESPSALEEALVARAALEGQHPDHASRRRALAAYQAVEEDSKRFRRAAEVLFSDVGPALEQAEADPPEATDDDR